MSQAHSPLYLASACLCGEPCRYDAKAATVPALRDLMLAGLALPVCPEVLGGLAVPRPPCERVGSRVLTAAGQDVTDNFAAGASKVLALAREYGIKTAILKERSPSCGNSFIYDGTFSGRRIAGQGVTAALLSANGVRVLSEENYTKENTMSDFLDLCLRRQSCRDFADKPVEHEKLVQCVEAARLAPSGCNSQPWSFVVVETPQKVAGVAECVHQLGINAYMATAKAFIVVLEEHAVLMPTLRKIFDSQYFAAGDLGAAVVSICYEATSLGLGSCILGIYDRPKLCELLDIPQGKRFAGVIALGYPSKAEIRPKVRKNPEEIVRFV